MHVKLQSKSWKPTPIFFRHENLLGSPSISRGVRSEVGGGGKLPRLPPVATPLHNDTHNTPCRATELTSLSPPPPLSTGRRNSPPGADGRTGVVSKAVLSSCKTSRDRSTVLPSRGQTVLPPHGRGGKVLMSGHLGSAKTRSADSGAEENAIVGLRRNTRSWERESTAKLQAKVKEESSFVIRDEISVANTSEVCKDVQSLETEERSTVKVQKLFGAPSQVRISHEAKANEPIASVDGANIENSTGSSAIIGNQNHEGLQKVLQSKPDVSVTMPTVNVTSQLATSERTRGTSRAAVTTPGRSHAEPGPAARLRRTPRTGSLRAPAAAPPSALPRRLFLHRSTQPPDFSTALPQLPDSYQGSTTQQQTQQLNTTQQTQQVNTTQQTQQVNTTQQTQQVNTTQQTQQVNTTQQTQQVSTTQQTQQVNTTQQTQQVNTTQQTQQFSTTQHTQQLNTTNSRRSPTTRKNSTAPTENVWRKSSTSTPTSTSTSTGATIDSGLVPVLTTSTTTLTIADRLTTTLTENSRYIIRRTVSKTCLTVRKRRNSGNT